MLGLERIHDVADFLLTHFQLERHEHARLSQVTVVFRNLILQNQMVPKGIPGQFRDKAMVLMGVLAIVSEDKVRGDLVLQLFKDRFDFSRLQTA